MHLQLVALTYCLPDVFDHLCGIRLPPVVQLLDQYQTLLTIRLYGKCRSTPEPQCWVALLYRQLDILRVVVSAHG